MVEDEAIIALAQARKLERHGYRVLRAGSGEEGVSLALEEGPDLVLMDIDLGKGIDGAEAARRILDQRNVPVVFLSSHSEPEIVEKSEAITSYGYIVKNSPESVLITSLRMAFRLHRAYRNQEEAFREVSRREETYRRIFENAPAGILHFDGHGRITECNSEFVQIIGSSREVLIGLDMTQLPDTDLVEALRRALAGKKGYYEGEYHSVTADKVTPVSGLFAPVSVQDKGKIAGGVGIFKDVSREVKSRRAAEEALAEVRRKEEKYRLLIETAPDAFLLGSSQGVITDVNSHAVTLTGYTREELVGQSIGILFDREELEMIPFRYDLLNQGLAVRSTRTLRRKDGSVCLIDMNTTRLETGEYQTYIRPGRIREE